MTGFYSVGRYLPLGLFGTLPDSKPPNAVVWPWENSSKKLGPSKNALKPHRHPVREHKTVQQISFSLSRQHPAEPSRLSAEAGAQRHLSTETLLTYRIPP